MELVSPTEFEPRLRECVVTHECSRMSFSEVCSMSCDFVSHHTYTDVFPILSVTIICQTTWRMILARYLDATY